MGNINPAPPSRPSRWQRLADRLARWAWPVLLVSVGLALVGGTVIGVWDPATETPAPTVDACEDPPCFGGNGLPGVNDLPVVLPFLGYGLAIALGLPSLIVGGWDLLRGRWAQGGRQLLAFVGPVLVLIGTEIVPHLVSPCLPTVLGADWVPGVCEHTSEGVDIKGRWHPLDHALVGALPMVVLYRRALRRWHPDAARWRTT